MSVLSEGFIHFFLGFGKGSFNRVATRFEPLAWGMGAGGRLYDNMER